MHRVDHYEPFCRNASLTIICQTAAESQALRTTVSPLEWIHTLQRQFSQPRRDPAEFSLSQITQGVSAEGSAKRKNQILVQRPEEQ